MGAIAIIRDPANAGTLTAEAVLLAFQEQGFNSHRVRMVGISTLLWFPSPGSPAAQADWYESGERFAVCVGVVGYRGLQGQQALKEIAQTFVGPDSLSMEDFYGNFQLVVCQGTDCWLIGDRLGLIQLFSSHDNHLLSTSWLACLELTGAPSINRIGAQDYVLNGASHSHNSVVQQIELVTAGFQLNLLTNQAYQPSISDFVEEPPFGSPHEALEAITATLRSRTHEYLANDPQGIASAVSGGFDSRLVLAMLLEAGIEPSLFVYGKSGDEDVEIAAQIAKAIDMPVDHIDKGVHDAGVQSLDDLAITENCRFFDGTPIDGLFDPGSDRATRLKHAKSGQLQLNGGGGEIFRNFFYLRDRSYSATELVSTFYHPFCKDVFLSEQDYKAYVSAMAAGIATAVGGESRRLDRRRVEAVYPLYRVRFWTSRTNSIVARYGRYYTPLVDPVLVAQALRVPLAWKQFGAFESALISMLNPLLGQLQLGYGFSPANGPNRSTRSRMWLEQSRSPTIRRLTPRIKRTLTRLSRHPQQVAEDEFGLEVMALLRCENLQSEVQKRRAKSLQHLISHFGIQL